MGSRYLYAVSLRLVRICRFKDFFVAKMPERMWNAMNFKAQIMDEAAVERTLVRIAHQIIEKNHGTENLCLIGIKTRGIPLAERLAKNIEKIEGTRVPVGKLDITLYRDDLTLVADAPVVSDTHIPFDVKGMTVVLCDDVILRPAPPRAIDALISLGRPARIQLFSGSSTAATPSFRSSRILSAKTSPPPCAKSSRCASPSATAKRAFPFMRKNKFL